MQEQSDTLTNFAGPLGLALLKFLPAGLGAGIIILVDPPKTKRDLFARAFVAMAMSYLFGDLAFDFLRFTSTFSFIELKHKTAVDGLIGACGWFVAGGASVLLKRFRKEPIATYGQIKDALIGAKEKS